MAEDYRMVRPRFERVETIHPVAVNVTVSKYWEAGEDAVEDIFYGDLGLHIGAAEYGYTFVPYSNVVYAR